MDYLEQIEKGPGKPNTLRISERFEQAWHRAILAAEPAPLATTLERMHTISSLLRVLKQHMARLPETAEECRLRMQIYGVKWFRILPGGRNELVRAYDPALYNYVTEDGLETHFEMSPREAPGKLPTLHAMAAPFSPSLQWRYVSPRIILPEIVFRSVKP